LRNNEGGAVLMVVVVVCHRHDEVRACVLGGNVREAMKRSRIDPFDSNCTSGSWVA